MKKFFVTLMIFAILACTFSFTAFAVTAGLNANEIEVLDYWKQTVENFKIPTTALNQAELYFSTSFDMTTAQKDYILARTDEIIAIIKLEKKASLSDFSAAHKSEIASIIFATGSEMDITVVYNYSNNEITMTDSENNTIFVQAATLIKSTGRSLTPWFILSGALLAVAVTGLFISKRRASIASAK